MIGSPWLDAALFLLPAGATALALCGYARWQYLSCRDGFRALRSHALPALAASAMLYLSSLLLTAAAVALLFHA